MINLLLLLNNFYPLISYRRLLLLYAVRSLVTVRNQLPAQAVKNVQSRQLIFFSLVNKQTLCMKFFQLGVETNFNHPNPIRLVFNRQKRPSEDQQQGVEQGNCTRKGGYPSMFTDSQRR